MRSRVGFASSRELAPTGGLEDGSRGAPIRSAGSEALLLVEFSRAPPARHARCLRNGRAALPARREVHYPVWKTLPRPRHGRCLRAPGARRCLVRNGRPAAYARSARCSLLGMTCDPRVKIPLPCRGVRPLFSLPTQKSRRHARVSFLRQSASNSQPRSRPIHVIRSVIRVCQNIINRRQTGYKWPIRKSLQISAGDE
jgi:hypothetical protein